MVQHEQWCTIIVLVTCGYKEHILEVVYNVEYHFVKVLIQFDLHQEEKGEEGGGTVVKMVGRMTVIFVIVWTINFVKD